MEPPSGVLLGWLGGGAPHPKRGLRPHIRWGRGRLVSPLGSRGGAAIRHSTSLQPYTGRRSTLCTKSSGDVPERHPHWIAPRRAHQFRPHQRPDLILGGDRAALSLVALWRLSIPSVTGKGPDPLTISFHHLRRETYFYYLLRKPGG